MRRVMTTEERLVNELRKQEKDTGELLAELEAKIERLENAARSYRGILVGAEIRGDMSPTMSKEFDFSESIYADLLDS